MPLNLNALRGPRPTQNATRDDVQRVAQLKPVIATFQWFHLQEPNFRKTHLEMVQVPSPPFGEQKRGEWMKKQFMAAGLTDVEMDKIGNVTGMRKGTDTKAKLVALSAHMDTVFPAGTALTPRVEGSKTYLPGISDNGTGLMALLAIANGLKANPVKNSSGILFIANVGEEGEGDLRGMRYIFSESKWKDRIGSTLVLDGGGTDTIVTQALGSKRFEVVVHGPGGHSWQDFGTPNPIVVLSRAIAKFSEVKVPEEPRTSFNIGVISGGTTVNSIPESASAHVDIRSAAPEQIERLAGVLRESMEEAVAEVQDTRAKNQKNGITYEMKPIGDRPAGELKAGSRILEVVQAVDLNMDIKSNIKRSSTDANIPISMGREALSIGAGGNGGGAHTLHEWYDPTFRDLGLKRILLITLTLAGVKE